MDGWVGQQILFPHHLPLSLSKSINKKKKGGLNLKSPTLAGVAQWIECQPANQRVAGSIPSQATRLGHEPGPQEWALEKQPHTDVSLPLFLLPFPLSKNK